MFENKPGWSYVLYFSFIVKNQKIFKTNCFEEIKLLYSPPQKKKTRLAWIIGFCYWFTINVGGEIHLLPETKIVLRSELLS